MSTGRQYLKHSVEICGRQSSLSLEPEFWTDLRELAQAQDLPVSTLVTRIALRSGRRQNLCSEIRVQLLLWRKGGGDGRYCDRAETG